ncbi:Uncharacterised protein [BD1-7 clade bacterium]|uniref:DNA-binding domain-containing protein n=1 Tax=BD1-7 clade bacterium TaxID=2029982 RepID=A0A5S9NVH5_9GAMM|nr:Uncharacterised protein [BD1-7 clade bacterium]CAA0094675.1 Uncharacterised protein [BD1-7 clade bacterium]
MFEFQKQQAAFAAHIRNPEKNAGPENIEARRLKVYTELFFNNIEGFISGGFPVLKSLFSEEAWLEMVRGFVEHHQSHTPYFLEISEEFLAYLEDDQLPIHDEFPFARELAHYEWLELALDVADEEHDRTGLDANGNLLKQVPIVSSLAWPVVYQWPVHEIRRDSIPGAPSQQPVCIVVYRNRMDEVAFLEVNPVTLRLLEILTVSDDHEAVPDKTGEQALTQIAEEMQQSDVSAIIEFGSSILEQLRSLGIILGAVSR